jgi:signal transduction histidine kinase
LQRADIDDLKLLIEPEIRRKSLTLQWRNEAFDEVQVSPSVVRQVLLNLLLNACQATPPGGQVSLRAAVEDAHLVAIVEDSGPGLSDSAHDVLVGRRDQAVSASGSGLGLWMVRRLIREGGGTITVTPRLPEGTTIRVALPFAREEGLADVA